MKKKPLSIQSSRIQRTLEEIEHEIIVVDDGSQDGTAERALATGVKVISHPHNLGYGAALKTGIRAAKYDIIVITDADGTYPNEQIPLLLKEYNKGFDMVVGARSGQNYFEVSPESSFKVVAPIHG